MADGVAHLFKIEGIINFFIINYSLQMAISRKKYKSRREKYARDKRNFFLILIFGLLASIILIYKNRQWWYDWFMITFVD